MVNINPTRLIIILNANCYNAPIKRQTLSGQFKKQDITTCYLYKTYFKYKKTQIKSKWEEKHTMLTLTIKSVVAILISERARITPRKNFRYIIGTKQ